MRRSFLFTALLFFLSCPPLCARWDRVGPDGGRVRDTAAEKGILYAAGTGVFRSDDNAVSWQRTAWPFASFGTDSADPYISHIAVQPGNAKGIFAGGPQGLFKTVNSGAAWQKMSALAVNAVAFNADGTRVCVACPGVVLYSVKPFTVFTTVAAADFVALCADPLNTAAFIAARRTPHATGYSLMRTENGGQNWGPFPGLNTAAVDLAAILDGSGWLASTANGLARVERNGNAVFLHENPSRATTCISGDNGGIFNVTEAGSVYVLYNLSADWTALATGMQSRQPTGVVQGQEFSIVCGTENGGVLRYSDRWTPANAGLGMAEVFATAELADETGTWVAAVGDGLFKSLNQGDTWSLLHASAGPAPTAVSGVRILHQGLAGLQRSDDGGKVWRAFQNGLPTTAALVHLLWRDAGDTVLAVTDRQAVYRNTTSNPNWKLVLSALDTLPSGVPAPAIAPGTPTTMYLVRPGTGLQRTDNSGTDWTTVNAAVTAADSLLAVSPSDANVLFRAGTDGNGISVWKSLDGGAVWSQVYHEAAASGAGFRATVLAIDARQPNRLVLGTNRGLRVSLNGGTNWASEAMGPAGTFVSCWAPYGATNDFVGTLGGGVLVGRPGGILNARGVGPIVAFANTGADPTPAQLRTWDGNADGVITMRDAELALKGVTGVQ